MYEMAPAHTSTSPVTFCTCSLSTTTISSQLFASPDRPKISLSALTSWTVHLATSASSDAIFSTAALSAASSAATFLVTASSFASADRFEAVASPSSISAAASCLRLGSTSSAT